MCSGARKPVEQLSTVDQRAINAGSPGSRGYRSSPLDGEDPPGTLRSISLCPTPRHRRASMHTLRFLGAAAVLDGTAALVGPVAQRHRLALLAILDSAPERALPRERLTAMLWPESDSERARHLLAESTYVVRRALGDEVLRREGDRLSIPIAQLPSDVGRFLEAIGADELQRAVALYRGPFLDGFFLDGASGFSAWADDRRTELERFHRHALQRLAAELEATGDLPSTAKVLNALVVAERYGGRSTLSLMRVLAASGDREGALHAARAHELILRGELEAEPDAGVQEFATELRRRAVPLAVAGAPTHVRPPDRVMNRAIPETSSPGGDRAPSLHSLVPAETEHRLGGSAQGTPPHRKLPGGLSSGNPSRGTALVGLAILLAAVAAISARSMRVRTPGATADPVEAAVKVAVLAFADLGPERDLAWLGEGITEELIDALGRMEGVRVAGRTSSFALRGQPLTMQEIAARLGVDFVLDGSVRRAGSEIRVTARLVHASDGLQRWGATYPVRHEALTDVFPVQDSIAGSIVRMLTSRLAPRPGAVRRPASEEAFRAYRLGRFYLDKRTSVGLARAILSFQAAIDLDPAFAAAHAGMAWSHALLVTTGTYPPAESYASARRSAIRALELDATLAEAHAVLGIVHLYLEHDWVSARERLERAIRLNPDEPTSRQWYAMLLAYSGDLAAAEREIRRAAELDPLSIPIRTSVGTVLYYQRRWSEAAAAFREALDMEPRFPPARVQLAAAAMLTGDLPTAQSEVEHALVDSERHPLAVALAGVLDARTGNPASARERLLELEAAGRRGYVSPAYGAAIRLSLGDRDGAIRDLREAERLRDDWVVYLGVEPVFDPLRSDPRFRQLVRRVARRARQAGRNRAGPRRAGAKDVRSPDPSDVRDRCRSRRTPSPPYARSIPSRPSASAAAARRTASPCTRRT
jgi:TolB-like protein/DNA-binding SARP family transcriptional activator/tetratricopeptide (TPR) repeat protein